MYLLGNMHIYVRGVQMCQMLDMLACTVYSSFSFRQPSNANTVLLACHSYKHCVT